MYLDVWSWPLVHKLYCITRLPGTIRLSNRIRGSHSGSYESCNLLGHSAVYSVYEPTFRRNVSLQSSGSKISRARNQRASTAMYPKRRHLLYTISLLPVLLLLCCIHCRGSMRLGPQAEHMLTSTVTEPTVTTTKSKLRGLSPRANYIDRTTAACRQS
jgi:hypothetical protein